MFTSVRKAGICIGSMTRRTQAVNITEQWLLGECCSFYFAPVNLIRLKRADSSLFTVRFYLFIYLFICLFIYLFIHSFIHLFIYLFIYLFFGLGLPRAKLWDARNASLGILWCYAGLIVKGHLRSRVVVNVLWIWSCMQLLIFKLFKIFWGKLEGWGDFEQEAKH